MKILEDTCVILLNLIEQILTKESHVYESKPSCGSRLFKPYEQLPVGRVWNHRQPKLTIQSKVNY